MKNDDHALLQFATAESVRSELFRIGNVVNVWPLRREPLRHFSNRVALELEAAIAEREALLAIVLSLQNHPTCDSRHQSNE
jgi:hypothetical protein